MEKDLRKLINDFLSDFDANKINDYFANDFCDDWDIFLENTPKNILEFLNDEFYSIDTQYIDNKNYEKKIKETLKKALKMMDTKN